VEPQLEAGLARLSELQRTTVVLHHSFAWTHQEIAELLDLSVSTVRSHIERGMDKLRSALRVAVDG
jgi:RNA polymerase sigma-70 factor (ECF subfamily)